jgi:hypothetical protein
MSDYFVCPKCNQRVPAAEVTMDHDPGSWNSPMREILDKFRDENGESKPPNLPYHRRHVYAAHGGTQRFYLCGPLEEESEHEAYLNWVGSLR